MNKKDIANLKNNIKNNAKKPAKKPAPTKEKGFLDLYALVADGKVYPVYNDNDDIIALNNLEARPKGLRCSKMICGHMTVGDTEKERKSDEAALRKFLAEYSGKPIKSWFCRILQLVEAGIKPDRVDDVSGRLYYYLAADRKVIDEDGNDIVSIGKDVKIQGKEAVVEYLADKLLLRIQGIDPSKFDTKPKPRARG